MTLPHDKDAALEHCTKFCTTNGHQMCHVEFDPSAPKDARALQKGFYYTHDRHILLYYNRCYVPNARGKTWPGFSHDLTVLGVLAHETGHYVNDLLGWDAVPKKMYDLRMRELASTPYAMKDPHEDFAEACGLFIVNPSLLEKLRPRRHEFLTNDLGLKPVESRHWREILAESPRHLKMVENHL